MFLHTSFILVLAPLIYGGDLEELGLGSEDFRVRQAAARRLRRALPFSYFLINNGLDSADAEIRHRCRLLLRRAEDTSIIVRGCLNLAAIGQADRLLFGPGDWQLTAKQINQILSGGPRLHWALSVVAKHAKGLPDGISVYELDPANYDVELMVGFVSEMRRRLRGISD